MVLPRYRNRIFEIPPGWAVIKVFLFVIMIIVTSPASAETQQPNPELLVDGGRELRPKLIPGIRIGGRDYYPLREICSVFRIPYIWNPLTRRAVAGVAPDRVQLIAEYDRVRHGEQFAPLSSAPIVVGGELFTDRSVLVDHLPAGDGYRIRYQESSNSLVLITDPGMVLKPGPGSSSLRVVLDTPVSSPADHPALRVLQQVCAELKKRYGILAELAPQAIASTDAIPRARFANQSACSFFLTLNLRLASNEEAILLSLTPLLSSHPMTAEDVVLIGQKNPATRALEEHAITRLLPVLEAHFPDRRIHHIDLPLLPILFATAPGLYLEIPVPLANAPTPKQLQSFSSDLATMLADLILDGDNQHGEE